MKLKTKNLLMSMGSVVAVMAFMITSLNVNMACAFVAHQPELPTEAKSLRKF